MTWLPICLFLVLLANNAKLESEFINRLPRDLESSSSSSSSSIAPTPTSTASTPTESSSTASTPTESSSTASTPTESSSTASTPTESSSTASTPTESSSTASTSTESSSTASTPTESSSTAPTSTTGNTSEDNKKDGDECDADSLNNIVCENDRLQFCGPNNKIMSLQCIVKGRQGYCNCEKTGCVAQKPVCPGDKTKCYHPNTKLPDNLDCHKFTYCNENKEKVTLQCPGKLIYDMTTEKCLDSRSARCHKVSCPRSGKDLQLIPFPQAKNYYVLCVNGIGDVRKCPDKYYAIRNNKCQFDCKLKNENGVFQDSNPEQCRKGYYYICKRSGSNYITIPQTCPPGFIFDEDLEFCTQEDTCKDQEPENN